MLKGVLILVLVLVVFAAATSPYASGGTSEEHSGHKYSGHGGREQVGGHHRGLEIGQAYGQKEESTNHGHGHEHGSGHVKIGSGHDEHQTKQGQSLHGESNQHGHGGN